MPDIKEKGVADTVGSVGKAAHNAVNVGKTVNKAAQAGNTVMHANSMLKMMSAAKAGLSNIGAMGAGLGHSLWGGITSFAAGIPGAIANGVGGFFAGAGSWISSTFGVSSAAGTTAAVGATAAATVGVAGGGLAMINNQSQYDVAVNDCGNAVAEIIDAKAEAINSDAVTLDNAKKVWSVFHAWGLPNEQIAGMLGNWSVESGIDPTGYEGIFSEHFQGDGPIHKKAYADETAWTMSLFADYDSKDYKINKPFYQLPDGSYKPGRGLGQWTGANAKRLEDGAVANNKNWYDLDYQLAYALATPSPAGRRNYWESYKKEQGSVDDYTISFARNWEGNGGDKYSERQAAARDWLKQMVSWQEDTAYSASVIAMSQTLGAVASDGAVAEQLQSCVKAQNYDNSSAAAAAISFAYKTEEESEGNNGTQLWQTVFQNIFPGDSNYMSCDSTVATALRWSGTDEEIPAHNCPAIMSYFDSSDKWEKVGMSHDLEEKDLKPGDIIIHSDHVIMYVGNKLVREKYPDSNGNMVSGSLGERSPGVGSHISYYLKPDSQGNGGGAAMDYVVYRCVKPDNGTKYKDAGAGAN